MTTDDNYVERLEKIIDRQDALLSQLDAKFDQQEALNKSLAKQNAYLKEDIQKHRDLTRDMNKTVTQQKNVVGKLKKELEEQLKIQQDLHKDYGDVIKQLTDDLEEEQDKNEKMAKKQSELESEIQRLRNDLNKAKQTPSVTTSYYSSLNKSLETNPASSKTQTSDGSRKCPKCGAEVEKGYLFCESCGTKL